MRWRILFFFSLFLVGDTIKANETLAFSYEEFQLIIEIQDTIQVTEYDSIPSRVVKFKRGKAIIFTLLTGIFGGHRIYFGTHHRTPIIYSITFGGLGILPLIDLVHIIFTKDLSVYEHKSNIIMWGK